MAQLEDLNDDILFLVLQYLDFEHFSTLQRFRLVSWRLKDFAESQLYKDVIVRDDEDDIDATNRFIERLTNQRDTLSRHVRHFTVASFEGEDDSSCLNVQLFVKLMAGFQQLNSFSWNVDTLMPKEVLDAFHKHRPNTRLYVKTKTLDPILLSSPQLYSLEFSVACQNRFSSETLSLFRRLKNILLQSRGLRILSLDIHQDPYFRRLLLGEVDKGSLNLPFEPGDKMPPLEELTIKTRDYNFDSDHCEQWLSCMDWTRLRRLSFGLHHPGDFIAGLIGQTPKLQSLGFGYCGVMPKDLGDVRVVADAESRNTIEFVRSIKSLKELIIRCRSVLLDQPLWRYIAEKHGSSLTHLCIRDWNEYPVNTVPLGSLDLLSSYFPHLQQLDVDLDLESSVLQPGSVHFYWHKDQVTALSRLSHLRHLKISVQSNTYWHSILLLSKSREKPRELHEQLWWQFLDNELRSTLMTITLRFWRWEKRNLKQRDDAFKRVHIKQTFYISSNPKDKRNVFNMKIKVLGKADKFNVYGAKFQDCDGIS